MVPRGRHVGALWIGAPIQNLVEDISSPYNMGIILSVETDIVAQYLVNSNTAVRRKERLKMTQNTIAGY